MGWKQLDRCWLAKHPPHEGGIRMRSRFGFAIDCYPEEAQLPRFQDSGRHELARSRRYHDRTGPGRGRAMTFPSLSGASTGIQI